MRCNVAFQSLTGRRTGSHSHVKAAEAPPPRSSGARREQSLWRVRDKIVLSSLILFGIWLSDPEWGLSGSEMKTFEKGLLISS